MGKGWLSGKLLPLYGVAVLGALMVAGTLSSADEFEQPAASVGSDMLVILPLGDVTVEAYDAGGSAVDAKDMLEPDLTVMMLTSDVSVSSDETLAVQSSPTLETWAP